MTHSPRLLRPLMEQWPPPPARLSRLLRWWRWRLSCSSACSSWSGEWGSEASEHWVVSKWHSIRAKVFANLLGNMRLSSLLLSSLPPFALVFHSAFHPVCRWLCHIVIPCQLARYRHDTRHYDHHQDTMDDTKQWTTTDRPTERTNERAKEQTSIAVQKSVNIWFGLCLYFVADEDAMRAETHSESVLWLCCIK